MGLIAGRLTDMSPASYPSDAQLDAARWCRHLVPDGSVYVFLADHCRELFPAELVADRAARVAGTPWCPPR
jgi:hypothetical protein